VACLWDFLRRKIWVFASRFWPSVLEHVGIHHPSLPCTEAEECPIIIVLEVEHLENSIVVWKLRPDLLSTVQSRSVGLENGATPFEQPSTRALAPPVEDVHRPLLQAGVHQESAAQSDDSTQSTSDQLVHHPRYIYTLDGIISVFLVFVSIICIIKYNSILLFFYIKK
jgi:hypothetical protein